MLILAWSIVLDASLLFTGGDIIRLDKHCIIYTFRNTGGKQRGVGDRRNRERTGGRWNKEVS